jgi:Ca2+-binding RTX toxin-like protein
MRTRHRHRRATTAIGAMAVAALAAMMGAGPAAAGTASVTGTTLSYLAGTGEVNDVSMFLVAFGDQGLGQAVRELGSAPVVAGPGCQLADEHMAWCGASPTQMDADLGDMDDQLLSNDLGGTVHGGSGNDLLRIVQFQSGALYGDAGNDTLSPALGTWTLSGGSGDDQISSGCAGGCSGFGSLTVLGGAGRDRFSYAQRSGPVTVTLDDVANDGSGEQQDNIHADVEALVGGDAADSLTGSSADNDLEGGGGGGGDVLDGAGGDDRLSVFGSSNRVQGGAGDDRILTGGGSEVDRNTFAGGPDHDVVDFSERVAAVTVTLDGAANDGAGHDQVGTDVEDVVGTIGNDSLTGDGDSNDLDGGAGQDILRGGSGADQLHGGGGLDTADYADHSAALVLGANGQPTSGDLSDGPVGARDTIAIDIENLAGGTGDDRLVNTPHVANVLAGGPGRDAVDYSAATAALTITLDGKPGDGEAGEGDQVAGDVEDVLAGSGDDELRGSSDQNRLDGGGGDDFLHGAEGADDLVGGSGFDFADYSDRSATLTLTADGSPVSGDPSDGLAGARDRIESDVEGLVGGAGDDTLTGNALDNDLDGGLGADVLSGGAGTDTADYGDRTADVLVSLDGVANDGEDGERDSVGPGGDVENVVSGNGDDTLVGNVGSNRLDAGAGDDLLDGGPGPDALLGADGQDIVSYEFRSEPITAAIDGAPGSGSALDGPAGARDTIGHDVEHLWGGDAGDRLTGDAGSNLLYGGRGADVLAGGPGEDAADYTDRTASVTVSPNDVPTSGNADDGPAGARDTIGADVEDIFTGSGDDSVIGSGAVNYLDAGAGNDLINSRDAQEDLDACGDGADTALVDKNDLVALDCEAAFLPGQEPQPPSPTPPPASDHVAPIARLKVPNGQGLARVLRRGLTVTASCSERCRLSGRLLLDGRTAKRLGLGRRRKSVAVARGSASEAGTLIIHFSASAKRKLRGAKRLNLTLLLTAIDPSGNRATVERRILLTRARATASARQRGFRTIDGAGRGRERARSARRGSRADRQAQRDASLRSAPVRASVGRPALRSAAAGVSKAPLSHRCGTGVSLIGVWAWTSGSC